MPKKNIRSLLIWDKTRRRKSIISPIPITLGVDQFIKIQEFKIAVPSLKVSNPSETFSLITRRPVLAAGNVCYQCLCGEQLPFSLRLYQSDGQMWCRCHRCGTCRSILELALSHYKLRPEVFHRVMTETGQINFPFEDLQLYMRFRDQMTVMIEKARRLYAQLITEEFRNHMVGDWGLIYPEDLDALKQVIKFKSGPANSRYLVEFYRNQIGRICAFGLFDSDVRPISLVSFGEYDMLFSCSPMIDHYETSRTICIAENYRAAKEAIKTVPNCPVMVLKFLRSFNRYDNYPFGRIWLKHERESWVPGALALINQKIAGSYSDIRMVANRSQERMHKWGGAQSILSFIVDKFPTDFESGIIFLNSILISPLVPQITAMQLCESAARLYKRTVVDLADHIDIASSPYHIQIGRRVYFNRHGRFWRSGLRKRDEEPVSNFSADISRVSHEGIYLNIRIAGKLLSSLISAERFYSPPTLLRHIISHAASKGLVPYIEPGSVSRNLPQIIISTSALKQ